MNFHSLKAITPIDGRYYEKTKGFLAIKLRRPIEVFYGYASLKKEDRLLNLKDGFADHRQKGILTQTGRDRRRAMAPSDDRPHAGRGGGAHARLPLRRTKLPQVALLRLCFRCLVCLFGLSIRFVTDVGSLCHVTGSPAYHPHGQCLGCRCGGLLQRLVGGPRAAAGRASA